MIKNFLVSLSLLFSIAIFAQSGTPSPYSYYGIGDVTFKGTVENRLMGGVSIFPDSTHVNLTNPASFATLKYTSFALGGNANGTKFKTNDIDDRSKRNTIDYLALGFPLGKNSGQVLD
ncbi:hypothetical protein [Flavobacterium sp. 3HN19-14]|uniref:hypothetical protein n=1 Tax=Flavobacterium sp. 3HN19-14 TaxID=3448133 RepID=UPI003EDE83F5